MKTSPPASEFVNAGIPVRDWFDHYVITIPKPYPDALLHACQRRFPRPLSQHTGFVQLNLYATDLHGLPDELFSDKMVNWHQQQFGRKGLVAAAGLYLAGAEQAFVTVMQSDVCQQLSKHAPLLARCRTAVDCRFRHWYRLLMNAILDFCVEHGVATLFSPTCDAIIRFTEKRVQPQLFARVYDDISDRLCCSQVTVGDAQYWRIPISDNAGRIARLTPKGPASRSLPDGLCIFHDIEEDVDTPVSKSDCRRWLCEMLRAENDLGIPVTCSVLGSLFSEKMPFLLEHGVQSVAFHSYNHDPDQRSQLSRVRKVDLQVRGYRPPRSRLTGEITDYRLALYNFEWLLSSSASLGSVRVRLENGIVKIPVHLDDYALSTGKMTVEQWCTLVVRLLDRLPLVIVGLHDCYAGTWIGSYRGFLETLQGRARFLTCDEIADRVFVASEPLDEISGSPAAFCTTSSRAWRCTIP